MVNNIYLKTNHQFEKEGKQFLQTFLRYTFLHGVIRK